MKATVNGIATYYEIHGREGAPWLTFSHSLACSVRMWDGQIAGVQGPLPHSWSTTRAATAAARRRRGRTRWSCWRRICSNY